jgi:glucosamine-6-phosphate deaminase
MTPNTALFQRRPVIVPGPETSGRLAAAMIGARLTQKSNAVLGLATGSSVEPVYEALKNEQFGLRHCRMFALDEYVGLDAHDPQTYRHTLIRQLAGPSGLPESQLHTPSATTESGARAYDDEIAAAGGIDLQLLGIGSNGHLAFNEPGTNWSLGTHIVELDDRTRMDNARFFGSVDAVPRSAVTQGVATILRARSLVLLAHGAAKAEALRAALEEPPNEAVPASALQLHPDVTVFADREAAALLRR